MKKKLPARKKPRPQDFVWSRAGLTIQVCPIPRHPEEGYCVVLQDKDGGLLVKDGSRAACIDQFKCLAEMLGNAMDRVDQAGRYWPRPTRQGNAKTFDDVIQAMLCHPNGRRVLCRPRRPCRACRET